MYIFTHCWNKGKNLVTIFAKGGDLIAAPSPSHPYPLQI